MKIYRANHFDYAIEEWEIVSTIEDVVVIRRGGETFAIKRGVIGTGRTYGWRKEDVLIYLRDYIATVIKRLEEDLSFQKAELEEIKKQL
jgi:hypothetical protein